MIRTFENKLIVWGARGGLPASGNEYSKFGHATCCVHLETENKNFVFDAGTGIAKLGQKIIANNDKRPIDIFIGHYHFDHILGLPFFAPLFNKEIKINIYLPVLNNETGINALDKFLSPPLFPMDRSIFSKNTNFIEFKVGEEINLKNNIKCKTMPLPHPGLNTAFRMYSDNFDFVYASDVEAEQSTTIEDIAMFSKNTQYIFIDSSYTDKELEERIGWGHLSYQQVIDLAKKLKNSKVLIFHHDFFRSDQELEEILSNVLTKSNNLSVCKELSEFTFQ